MKAVSDQTSEMESKCSLVAQQVEGLVVTLLWHGFDPWHRNFHVLQAWPKKKKREKNI